MGATNRAPTPTYLNPGTVCQFMLLYVKKKIFPDVLVLR
jgi:hypothetical protein